MVLLRCCCCCCCCGKGQSIQRCGVLPHVLDNSHHGHLGFLAKIELLPDIGHADLFGGGHQNRPRHGTRLFQVLYRRDVLVGRPRRRVDDQVIEAVRFSRPIHLRQELLDQSVLSRAPPDDGLVPVLVRQQEGYRNAAQIGLVRVVDGNPSTGGRLRYLCCRVGIAQDHSRSRRAAEINVQQAHRVAHARQGVRQLAADGRLADPALPAQDEDRVGDVLQGGFELRGFRLRPGDGFRAVEGTGSAGLLVRASVAGGGFSGIGRRRTDAFGVGVVRGSHGAVAHVVCSLLWLRAVL
mmetsp:Transcript_109592/g.223974  ORF Transcript_109592/g.223974 Transcript_109592/m.223974 type:complete len:295 (-) Transcript_109592:60-944(-)